MVSHGYGSAPSLGSPTSTERRETAEAALRRKDQAAPAAQLQTDQAEAKRGLGLRIGFAVTAGFLFGEVLDWELSFLIPVLAVQLLAAAPTMPSFRQGLAMVVLFGSTTGAALIAGELLAGMPVLFTTLLSLVIFLAFYLQARQQQQLLSMLLLVSFTIVPVVAVREPTAATTVASAVFRSGVVAVILVWLMFALFPSRPMPALPDKTARPCFRDTGFAMREALVNTAVIMPVLVAALTFTKTAIIFIVMTISAILSQRAVTQATQAALGLFLGNLLGGITAIVAYQLLRAVPTLSFFAALLLFFSLAYGFAVERGGTRSQFAVIALVTFLIVLGMGVSPILDDPATSLSARIANLGFACAYAFLALGLIQELRRFGRTH
jgi:hypothetical protein